MPFVMTRADETVEVEFEINGEILTLTIGAIPNEVGEKIQELGLSNQEILKASIVGDKEKVAEIMSKNISALNQMTKLLCKYGIRDHKGIEYSDGSPVPCKTETEDKTKHTILTEETLNLYLGNEEMISLASGAVMSLRHIGVGKYKKGGFKTIKEAQEDGLAAPL